MGNYVTKIIAVSSTHHTLFSHLCSQQELDGFSSVIIGVHPRGAKIELYQKEFCNLKGHFTYVNEEL